MTTFVAFRCIYCIFYESSVANALSTVQNILVELECLYLFTYCCVLKHAQLSTVMQNRTDIISFLDIVSSVKTGMDSLSQLLSLHCLEKDHQHFTPVNISAIISLINHFIISYVKGNCVACCVLLYVLLYVMPWNS